MPLKLAPLEESDYPTLVEIAWEVFDQDYLKLVYPAGSTRAIREYQTERGLKEWRANKDTIKLMKVVDTDVTTNDLQGQIISVAKWIIHPYGRSEEDIQNAQAQEEPGSSPSGMNVDFLTEHIANATDCRKQIVGTDAHVYLEMLATRPAHYRRGAAAMQMRWGLNQADELGLQSYLESSEVAVPFYEQHGYMSVMPLPLDARKWGLDTDLKYVGTKRTLSALLSPCLAFLYLLTTFQRAVHVSADTKLLLTIEVGVCAVLSLGSRKV